VDENGKVLKTQAAYVDFDSGIKHITRPIEESKLNDKFLEVNYSGFNGFLISSKVIKEVGFPNRHFSYLMMM